MNQQPPQSGPAREYLDVDIPSARNELSHSVIGLAMEVHRTLGCGLMERQYEDAFAYELECAKIPAARQVPIRVKYKAIYLTEQRLDLLVANLIVVELKAIEAVHESDLARMLSYMRAGNFPLGLLFDFRSPLLKDGLYRRINPHACPKRSHSHLSSSSSSSCSSSPAPSSPCPASSSPSIPPPSSP